jgi:pimeloyl-ACP methyl ester carboxylesterase
MGGIVAFEIWRRAGDRVTHLALLDTTPYTDAPERQEVRLEQIAMAEAGKLRELMVTSMKPLYLARKNRGNRRLVKRILDMALTAGPEVFRRQSLALRNRPASTATLATITCPALVLCGREDALCPVDVHATMAAAMPRADLQVLADCGHLSTMEEPAAVATALRRLLRRAP